LRRPIFGRPADAVRSTANMGMICGAFKRMRNGLESVLSCAEGLGHGPKFDAGTLRCVDVVYT
jgi:hypothetical protein